MDLPKRLSFVSFNASRTALRYLENGLPGRLELHSEELFLRRELQSIGRRFKLESLRSAIWHPKVDMLAFTDKQSDALLLRDCDGLTHLNASGHDCLAFFDTDAMLTFRQRPHSHSCEIYLWQAPKY